MAADARKDDFDKPFTLGTYRLYLLPATRYAYYVEDDVDAAFRAAYAAYAIYNEHLLAYMRFSAMLRYRKTLPRFIISA